MKTSDRDRTIKAALTIGFWLAVIVICFSIFIWRADRFEARCHDKGGTMQTLAGRDQHHLCLSSDGRLLDEE